MIKVVQAAGRVIRTEDDRGKILLMDKRFSLEPYKFLLPNHWKIYDFMDSAEISGILKNFHGEKNN